MKSLFKTAAIITLFCSMLDFYSCKGDHEIADAYGNFEAEEVLVSAQSQGIIMFLDADEGAFLDKNQLIGIIDTNDVVFKLEQIRAQLTVISAKIKNLEAQLNVQHEQRNNLAREVERMRQLLEDQAATQQQYDDIEGRLRVHDLQTETLESQRLIMLAERSVLFAQLSEANNLLDKCRIINPIAGTVLEKYAEAGELVTPGKAVYKIANLEEMELKFYISGDQLASVSIGDSVKVAIDIPGERMETLPGVVSWISSEVEFTPKIIQTREERVNMVYAVKLKVANDGQLKIGMPGEVIFLKEE